MEQKYPHLCSPITIGRVNFRNRMFSAPMGGTDITANCGVGPRTPGFYELRAKGGRRRRHRQRAGGPPGDRRLPHVPPGPEDPR